MTIWLKWRKVLASRFMELNKKSSQQMSDSAEQLSSEDCAEYNKTAKTDTSSESADSSHSDSSTNRAY